MHSQGKRLTAKSAKTTLLSGHRPRDFTMDRFATAYSATNKVVKSHEDVRDVIFSTFTNEVKVLDLAKFNNGIGPNFKGLFLVDADGIPVSPVGESSVSSKYRPHTRNHLVSIFEACRIAFGSELNVDCFWRDGHILVIQPTREAAVSVYGADKIVPKLKIFGGYAGKGFKASFGFYRYICSNMALLQLVHQVSATIRHTLTLETKIDDLVSQFETVKASWAETQEQIKKMQERKLVVHEVLGKLFPVDSDGREKTQRVNKVKKIVDRCLDEHQKLGLQIEQRDGDFVANGWMLWNAVQGFLQHNATRQENELTIKGLNTWESSELRKAEELILAC